MRHCLQHFLFLLEKIEAALVEMLRSESLPEINEAAKISLTIEAAVRPREIPFDVVSGKENQIAVRMKDVTNLKSIDTIFGNLPGHGGKLSRLRSQRSPFSSEQESVSTAVRPANIEGEVSTLIPPPCSVVSSRSRRIVSHLNTERISEAR